MASEWAADKDGKCHAGCDGYGHVGSGEQRIPWCGIVNLRALVGGECHAHAIVAPLAARVEALESKTRTMQMDSRGNLIDAPPRDHGPALTPPQDVPECIARQLSVKPTHGPLDPCRGCDRALSCMTGDPIVCPHKPTPPPPAPVLTEEEVRLNLAMISAAVISGGSVDRYSSAIEAHDAALRAQLVVAQDKERGLVECCRIAERERDEARGVLGWLAYMFMSQLPSDYHTATFSGINPKRLVESVAGIAPAGELPADLAAKAKGESR